MLSDVLREAIFDSGMTLSEIQRQTGVQRESMRRFLDRERSLRLDKAEILADYFGLELRSRK